MIEARTRPSASSWRQFAVAAVFCLIVGGVAGTAAGVAQRVDAPAIVTLAIGAAALAALLACTVWWWARLDEAAREAHKWAWWWGGSAGMALGGALLIGAVSLIRDGGTPDVLLGRSPDDLLYAGAMGMILCQVLGYGIAWAFWWLRRR